MVSSEWRQEATTPAYNTALGHRLTRPPASIRELDGAHTSHGRPRPAPQQPLLSSPLSNFGASSSKVVIPGHLYPSRGWLESHFGRAPYFLLDEVLPIGVPNAVKVTARIARTSASSASSCLGSFASASTHPCTVGMAALRTSAACSFISWGCFPATSVLGQHK